MVDDADAWGRDDDEPLSWQPTPNPQSVPEWLRVHPGIAVYAVVALLTCAVLAGVIVTVHALGSTRTERTGSIPRNQAGYLWCCDVRNMSAEWDVPQLVQPAPQGAEAIWIGAQTLEGTFFLQAGTNEYVNAGTSQYQAFWSDGPLNGSPQSMGTLAPGDEVRAQLRGAAEGGWNVTFVDQTQGWTHSVHVDYRASSVNAVAEWIEEDPVAVDANHGSSLFHMARTRGTTLSSLLVNGQVPVPTSIQSESFVDGSGITFSPTAVVHDAFSLHPW